MENKIQRMQERLKIKADLQNGVFEFKMAEPVKENAKQMENDRQLQETARQNQMKAAKPMGGGGGRAR